MKIKSRPMQAIHNLIFDFGGVLLNIDFGKTLQAFERLGIDRMSSAFTGFSQSSLFDRLETGKITPASFFGGLREMFEITLTDDELADAWNALLLDLPPERVELLRKAAKHYRIFLLSNTNEIHYRQYNGAFREVWGHDFDALFEKAWWSFRIGLRKPDRDIFEWVLKDAGLDPAATLFIDDTLRHVEGARLTGLHGYHLRLGEETIAALFDAEGKLLPEVLNG